MLTLLQARILAFLAAHWLDFAVAILLAVVVVGFAKHERNVQAAKDAGEIRALGDQLKVDRDVFRAIKAAEDRNKALAAAQAAAGQAALAEASRKAKADERAWRDKLAQARKAIAQVTCADQPLPDGVDL